MSRELPLLACDSVAINLRSGKQTQHRVPMKKQKAVCRLVEVEGRGLAAEGGDSVTHIFEYAPWNVGDVLYVREATACTWFSIDCETGYADDWGNADKWPKTREEYEDSHFKLIYRADGGWDSNVYDRGFKWTPNILVPKWASRTRLEVKRVWCERIQSISSFDAHCEIGEALSEHTYGGHGSYAIQAFEQLWISLYGQDAWTSNQWVWACELERIKP